MTWEETLIHADSVQRARLEQQTVELEAWREAAQSIGAVYPDALARYLQSRPKVGAVAPPKAPDSPVPERRVESDTADAVDWTPYRLKGLVEMRPYVPGEDLTEIHVGDPTKMGSGMICRDPDNPDEKHWYLDNEYVAKHYEPVANEATKEGA